MGAFRGGQIVRDGQAGGRATLVVEALVAQAGVLPAAILLEEPVGEANDRSTMHCESPVRRSGSRARGWP